jgi:TRAP-type C4-dicarboxylate transport system substrate-binding protein
MLGRILLMVLSAAGAVVVLVTLSGPVAAQTRLTFNFFPPPSETNYGNVLVPYLEKVSHASEGTITIDSFPGGSLGKNPRLQLKMMADGVFDITWAVAAYTPGRFPDNGVMELPGIFKTGREASVTLWRMYQRGLLRGFEKIKVLGFGALPPYLIHSRKRVDSVADLRNLKIRAGGPIHGAMIKGFGAAPVGLPAPSVAESISRGAIDGASFDWIGAAVFRVNDVTTFHYEAELGSNVLLFVMDRKRFDGLPGPARVAFDRLGGEKLSRDLGANMDRQVDQVRARIMQDPTRTIVVPQGTDLANLDAIKAKVVTDWLARTDSGARMLAAVRSIVADVRAGR